MSLFQLIYDNVHVLMFYQAKSRLVRWIVIVTDSKYITHTVGETWEIRIGSRRFLIESAQHIIIKSVGFNFERSKIYVSDYSICLIKCFPFFYLKTSRISSANIIYLLWVIRSRTFHSPQILRKQLYILSFSSTFKLYRFLKTNNIGS